MRTDSGPIEAGTTGTTVKTDAVVVGAGQAGLAVARELSTRGIDHLVVDAGRRIGESWRDRWDSLIAFTPAEHDGLPGVPFPAARGTFPSKDEIASYLEEYAAALAITVRLNECALGLTPAHGRWTLETDRGRISARQVVVATGTNALPHLPPFAGAIDSSIHQLHSSDYTNPTLVPPGDVLVVGAGTSGAEIALELANDGFHRVTLAGRPTVHVPNVVMERAGALYWWFVDSALTMSTLAGRKAADGFHRRGAPLIRISMKELRNAGTALLPRIDRVESGLPTLADGSQIGAPTIIWATGYRPDYQWITGLEIDPLGWPVHDRGVSASSPGLYFAGIPFQYALTSGLIGGVGRDAAHVANRIAHTAIAHT